MKRVIVAGGGVIGLACAVELQRRGLAVDLIEKDKPGEGCSLGNAGIIAASEIFPLITPGRLKAVPGMLLSRTGPAVIGRSAFPGLIPWMLCATAALTPRRQRHIVESLVWLNSRALAAWQDLLGSCGSSGLINERGMLEIFRGDTALPVIEQKARFLRSHGLPANPVDADAIAQLEPALKAEGLRGLLHGTCAHVADPLLVSRALFKSFIERGGRLIADEVLAITPEGEAARITLRSGEVLSAPAVLMAAGMGSASLLAPLRGRPPLQAERGYHLMLGGAQARLSRPLILNRESFAITPMAHGLRLAGTVEFSALDSPPRWERVQQLHRLAQAYFRDPLPEGDATQWIGSRPSLPDSLPAIGRLRKAPAIAYAFGHQHLGLTQAAITARLVADALTGQGSGTAISPFALERFG